MSMSMATSTTPTNNNSTGSSNNSTLGSRHNHHQHHHLHSSSSGSSSGSGITTTLPANLFPKALFQHPFQHSIPGLHEAILAGRNLISAMELKLRCSATGCECANFIAAKDKLRICDGCSHSWITHLFEKLLRDDSLSIFDVCSLALYGTHALPIRLKIVIERLLGTLQPEEIDKILRSFGWTPQDLSRGYMIQDPRGGLLTRWSMLPREEEILILQQFLRFSPTRTLSFALVRDDLPIPSPAPPASPPEHQMQQSYQQISPIIDHHHHHSRSRSQHQVHRDRDSHRTTKPPPQPPPDEPALNLSSIKNNNHNNKHRQRSRNGPIYSSSDEDGNSQPPVDLSSKRSKSEEPQHAPPPPPPPTQPSQNQATPVNINSLKTEMKSEQQQRSHWSPTANATQLINPATGKRRVQCSQCLKTFCDKGALKIHFSAVHLREMHRCTVAGCNMMFSSRRSRNRHSANPNPKLHSPHMRRRISPHDGRTSQPILNLNPQIFDGISGIIPCFRNGTKEEIQDEMTYDEGKDEGMNNHAEESEPESSVSLVSSNSEKSNSAQPESESRKDGARKRKLSNPVRLPSVPYDSNDDFCCYDDGTEVVSSHSPPGDEDPELNNLSVEEKNHLERLEALPIFTSSNQSDSGSNDENGSSPNGSLDGDSIPIDKDNPRRCVGCGKMFQNQFGLRTHYQNVHLKLMHKCTVDGCNAAFPSKRSRDRHSSNLNLHRKLLSTTSDVSNESTEDPPLHQRLNPTPGNTSIFNPFLVNGSSPSLNHVTAPSWNPFLPFPLFPGVFPAPPSTLPPTTPNNKFLRDDCSFCGKSFESPSSLESHLESVHSGEGLACKKCNRLFFSRRKLDTHTCINDSTNNNNINKSNCN